METFGKYMLIFIVSLLLYFITIFFDSTYIKNIFSPNIFTISIAIFSIYMSLTAILISQLCILKKAAELNTTPIIKSIKSSIVEYMSIMVALFIFSNIATAKNITEYDILIQHGLFAGMVFMLSLQIWIMYDVTKSLLICLDNA